MITTKNIKNHPAAESINFKRNTFLVLKKCEMAEERLLPQIPFFGK
jgi:hypothetical protein